MRTVAIYGLGTVGMTVAANLISQHQVDELILLDLDEQRSVAVVNDLKLAYPFFKRYRVQEWSSLDQAKVLVVACGELNSIQPQLAKHAKLINQVQKQITGSNFGGIVINLMQPNEATTAFIQQQWQLPPQRVIGTGTMSDTQALKLAIGESLQLASDNVTGYVYGQHDGRLVPAWSTIRVNGRFNDQAISGHKIDQNKLVINARLINYYIKRGQAGALTETRLALELIQAILEDRQAVYTLAVNQPQFGGYVSFPVMLGQNGVQNYLLLKLYSLEEEQLKVARQAIADQELQLAQS